MLTCLRMRVYLGYPVRMLVKAGTDFPTDHYVSDHITVPAIRREDVQTMYVHRDDITSHSTLSPFRDAMVTAVTINTATKSYVFNPDVVDIALSGGGDYWICCPNENHYPMTYEEHLEQIERNAEEAFWDYY